MIKEVDVCFVITKSFDGMDWITLIEILHNTGVDLRES